MRKGNARRLEWPSSGLAGWLFLFALLFPVVAAIWILPWFVTEDGPAHLYNAYILGELIKGNQTLAAVYAPRWSLLPNLTGHLALLGLIKILPARAADRILMTVTHAGFAASIFWLRRTVARREDADLLIVPLVVILTLSWMWLLGFYSFLVGATLAPLTLTVWWQNRDRLSARHILLIAVLLVLGFFSHIVSVGLTALALVVLALTTPGTNHSLRLLRTLLALAPLLPLGLAYRTLMKRGGGQLAPGWSYVDDPWSLHDWYVHFKMSDPLRLYAESSFPFMASTSSWFSLLSPALLVTVALLILVCATLRRDGFRPNPRRAWAVLSGLVFVVWLVGPDHVGGQHGLFLRERLILFTIICLIPFLRVSLKDWKTKFAGGLLVFAVLVQVCTVLDYATESNRSVSEYMRAKPFVGQGKRVVGLMVLDDCRFRLSSMLNLEMMFGVGTDNIVWNNYEAVNYMFPVRFRDARFHDLSVKSLTLSKFGSCAGRDPLDKHLRDWSGFLAENHQEIDVLVVWGDAPGLDASYLEWYGPSPVFAEGRVRVLYHR